MNWPNRLRQYLGKHDDGRHGGGKWATLGSLRNAEPLRINLDPTIEARKSHEQGSDDAQEVKPPPVPSPGFTDSEASFHDGVEIPPTCYAKKTPGEALRHGNRPLRRILLLDDDVELCEVLVAGFHWSGFEVVVTHRGADALRAVMKEDFDAVICDVVMPGMRGDMFYIALERVKPHLC
jgi:hypothetical protein